MGWEAGAGVVSPGSPEPESLEENWGDKMVGGGGGGAREPGSDSQGSEHREDSPGKTLLS